MHLHDVWTLQTRSFAEGQKKFEARTFYADFQDKWIFKHFILKLHGFYASDEHLVGI